MATLSCKEILKLHYCIYPKTGGPQLSEETSLTDKVCRLYWEKSPGHDRQVNKLTNKKRKIFYQAVKKRSLNCLFPKLPSGLYIRKRLMACYLAPPCADLSFSKECSQGRETHSVLTSQWIRYWVKHLGDCDFLSQQQFQNVISKSKNCPYYTM